MQEKIIPLLHQLEQEKNIQILYACESGSRAWGFPSPDSDYDIRFIYRHSRNWYLSLQEKKDTIEFMKGELLDGNGWDIRKVLRLLYKSNASLHDWLFSPVIYLAGDKRIEDLRALARELFLPKKAMHHYLGIAKGMLEREFKTPKVKIKKYFYVIRPVLAAHWIAETLAIPPVDFHELLPSIQEEKAVYVAIQRLLEEKEGAKEGQRIARIPELDQFIEQQMENLEKAAQAMDRRENTYEALDTFYQKYILEL